MTAFLSKTSSSLPPFVCDQPPDDDVPFSRSLVERKSIAVDRRVYIKQEVDPPHKSQSASDLRLFRTKTSSNAASSSNASSVGAAVKSIAGARLSDTEKQDSMANTTASKRLDQNNQSQRSHKESTASSISPPSQSGRSPTNAVNGAEEVDGGGRKLAHRERRFRRLFRNVPTTEILLSRYACAYVSDLGLLLQGHMYVSNKWICFHSNVFGIEKIIEIPVENIITVSKAHTAKIIPNAVRIKTPQKYYLFGSLMSRDNTYRLLIDIISRAQREEEENNCKLAPPTDTSLVISTATPEAEESDVASMASGVTTDTASSSPADDTSTRPDSLISPTPADAGAVEEPEPVIWRRFFQTNGSIRKIVSQAKGNEDESMATNSALANVLNWFFGLPKTIALLIICVILVAFLFLCASILTIRLMYLRSSSSHWVDSMPWIVDSSSESVLISHRTLDSMASALDSTLSMMDEVKRHLSSLKMEMRNGLREGVTIASGTACDGTP